MSGALVREDEQEDRAIEQKCSSYNKVVEIATG